MTPEPALSPTVAPTMALVTPAGVGAASVGPTTPPSLTKLLFAAQVGDDVIYLRDPSGISQGDSLTLGTPDHSRETRAVKGVNVGAVILDSAIEHSFPVNSTVLLRRASSASPSPSPTSPPRSRWSSPHKSFLSFTWLLLAFAVIVMACLSLKFLGYTCSSDSLSARMMKDLGRQDMVKKVFHSFDRDGDTLLSSDELMLFASCLPHDPFIGTRWEWDEHCRASIGSAHVDLERFRQLVDTRDQEGDPLLSLYQTDEDLRRLLEMHSSDFRRYMLSSVFDIFDVDRDGILSKEELRVFAYSMSEEPFEGTAEDWEAFYTDIVNKDGPIDLELFRALVDDRDVDAPLGLSDTELAQMAATSLDVSLRVRREQMISVLFGKFDRNHDGILNKEELLHFAQSLPHDPFEGSPEHWDVMYRGYVQEIGEPVDQERFAWLLDSAVFDDNPLELTDDEIMTMVWPEGAVHEEDAGENDSADSSEGAELPATPREC